METNILELQDLLQKLTLKLTRLQQLKDQEPTLRQQIQAETSRQTENESKLKEIVDQEITLYSKAETLKGLIKSIEQDLPATVRSVEALETQISQMQKLGDQLKLAYDQALESVNQWRETYASAQADKQNALKNREEAEKQKATTLTAFRNAW
jgi:chromosome segregation ATPase